MNRRRKFVPLLLVALTTSSAFAATRASLVVHSPVVVGTTQLTEGEYSLQWDGVGPTVELKIKKKNKVQVAVPATLQPVSKAFQENAIIVSTDVDGTRKLVEIRPSGQKFRIEIGSQPTESAARQKSSQ